MEDTDAGTEHHVLTEHRGRPRRRNAVIEVRFLNAQYAKSILRAQFIFPSNLADLAQPLADKRKLVRCPKAPILDAVTGV